MRRARLEQAWKDKGYTFVKTASGKKAIKEKDIELAERARKLATPPEPAGDIHFGAALATKDKASTGIFGTRKILILRATIILIGCVLAGIALKVIFRKGTEWDTLS